MAAQTHPDDDKGDLVAAHIADLNDTIDRYRKALEEIAATGGRDWCEKLMEDDHFVSIDHKDEVSLGEAILTAHDALKDPK